jgi:hypothetical protein
MVSSRWASLFDGSRILLRLAVGVALVMAGVATAAPKAPAPKPPGLVDVKLATKPAGARVEIDGEALPGVTPLSTKLSPGRHRLAFTLEGFAPLNSNLTVKAGKPQRVELRLAALPAKLTVTSGPDGALGALDGVAQGKTPFTVTADAGVHRVSAELPGYRPARREVELAPGSHATIELALEPMPVRVELDVTPVGSALTVDGADAGVSPATLELAVGPHAGLATHPGFRASPLSFELKAGAPARVVVALEPDVPGAASRPSPPLPPPPPPPREELALVADEKVDLEVKLGIVRSAAQRSVDVTALVQATRPRNQRGVLCTEILAHASTVSATVRALDPFGEPVTGTLLVDGRRAGSVPFQGELPVCTGTLSVTDVGTKLPVERVVELEQDTGRAVEVQVPGRRVMAVFSLLAEYDTLSWSPLLGAGTTEAPHVGGGLRYDSWARVLHFNVALKTSPAVNVPASKVLGPSVVPGVLLGGFPTADLFFGWGSALGNLAIDRLRLHWAFDVGLWGLLYPTVRASLAFNIFDRVFITIGGDLHFNPLMLVLAPTATAGQNPFATGVLFPGITGALGVGF